MRDMPSKFFGAVVFFVLCIILIIRDSPASRKEHESLTSLGERHYAFEESCPFSDGEILEKVGEVEKDLKSVQQDLKEYKRTRER